MGPVVSASPVQSQATQVLAGIRTPAKKYVFAWLVESKGNPKQAKKQKGEEVRLGKSYPFDGLRWFRVHPVSRVLLCLRCGPWFAASDLREWSRLQKLLGIP